MTHRFDSWERSYREFPDLYLGSFLNSELIGIAYGRPSPRVADELHLEGIAVKEVFYGRGYGSRLLRDFEQQAVRAGCKTVSLGSAGGYVDHFYMKNGYEPVSFAFWVPLTFQLPPTLRAKYAISDDAQEKSRRLSVTVTSLDNELRERLLTDFKVSEVVAIMVKRLV